MVEMQVTEQDVPEPLLLGLQDGRALFAADGEALDSGALAPASEIVRRMEPSAGRAGRHAG